VRKYEVVLIILVVGILLLKFTKKENVTFQTNAIMKDGKQEKVWIKAEKDKNGWYNAIEWKREPFEACEKVESDYHYRTYYPFELLKNKETGEEAVIVDLKDYYQRKLKEKREEIE
jgi:hypothetical protein